jgi:VCBS repeat-containing protein
MMNTQQFPTRLCMVALLSTVVLVACNNDNKKSKANHAPTASDLMQATQADTGLKGNLAGSDSDGDALTYTLITQATSGQVTVNTDGSFSYQPKADSTGSDQFTYAVSDGKANSATATVKITINPLDVNFGSYSRKVFTQAETATPLPLDSRNITQDVSDPTAYDDLLK